MSLPGGRCDLWLIDTTQRASTRTLSPREQARASAMRGEQLRTRYVSGRTQLRQLLASYVSAPPCAIRFGRTVDGKPFLVGAPIAFSFSRCDGRAACVVVGTATAAAIGVDIEHVRPLPERDRIVATWFTPVERGVWRRAPAAARDALFFRWWTRKEAILKALGVGLKRDVRTVDVSLAASPCDPNDDVRTQQGWHLREVHACGAVVTIASEYAFEFVTVREWASGMRRGVDGRSGQLEPRPTGLTSASTAAALRG